MAMNERIREILVRDRFTPGQKVHKKGELAEMEGTPGPHYSDPTGDDACWAQEVRDPTHQVIQGLARTFRNANTILNWVWDLNNWDVKKRAERTIPPCMACGDLIYGRVKAGFCSNKCYPRWTRSGRPDRLMFIKTVQAEVAAQVAKESASSTSSPAPLEA